MSYCWWNSAPVSFSGTPRETIDIFCAAVAFAETVPTTAHAILRIRPLPRCQIDSIWPPSHCLSHIAYGHETRKQKLQPAANHHVEKLKLT